MNKEILSLLNKINEQEILNLFKGLTDEEKRKLQKEDNNLKIVGEDLQIKIRNELMIGMECDIYEPTLLKMIINKISNYTIEVEQSKYYEMINSNEVIDFNELQKVKVNEDLIQEVEKDLLDNEELFLKISNWLKRKLGINRINKKYVIRIVSAYMQTLA